MNISKAFILGLSNTGEKIPAASGRISTQEGTATQIFEKSQDEEKNKKLIFKVTQSGHTSTIEHTVFNIAFENVSVFAEQFIIEFRLASFTVKSRRYVDFSNSGFYTPDFLKESAKEKYEEHMKRLFADYTRLTDMGIPKEDARFILPYCLYSNFFCTVNARELVNMIRSMIYGRGARFDEIKNLGLQLLNSAKEKAPGIFTEFEERAEKINYADFPVFNEDDKQKTDEFTAELLGYEANGAKTVAVTALLEQGYSYGTAEKIAEKAENREIIINYLVHSARPRALENTAYTFSVRGISLACLTHFARHRMQSIGIPSLTKANRTAHVMPTAVKENNECLEIFEKAFEATYRLYKEMKAEGMSEEELVYTLLSGNLIDIVTTMNARELLLFFKLRCCTRAQWEIREHADKMLLDCRKIEPEIFKFFGPGCFAATCPEGRMSCGKASEIKKKYSMQQA